MIVAIATAIVLVLSLVIIRLVAKAVSDATRQCDVPVPEPDVITRLAAIGDPKSEAAQQVRDYEAWIKYRDVMLKRVDAATTTMARLQARSDFLGRKCGQ